MSVYEAKVRDLERGFWRHSLIWRGISRKIARLRKVPVGPLKQKAQDAKEYCRGVIGQHMFNDAVFSDIRHDDRLSPAHKAVLTSEFRALQDELERLQATLDEGFDKLGNIKTYEVHTSNVAAWKLTEALYEKAHDVLRDIERISRRIDGFAKRL